jgi:hypothetical protein
MKITVDINKVDDDIDGIITINSKVFLLTGFADYNLDGDLVYVIKIIDTSIHDIVFTREYSTIDGGPAQYQIAEDFLRSQR